MLIFGADREIARWVSNHLFGVEDAFDERAVALGVAEGTRLIAGLVYNNFHPNLSIEMSIASVSARWATRKNLNVFFAYPFIQLGLERVTAICEAENMAAIQMNHRLGFTREGLHRKAYCGGKDAVSFGMLKHECKWI